MVAVVVLSKSCSFKVGFCPSSSALLESQFASVRAIDEMWQASQFIFLCVSCASVQRLVLLASFHDVD